MCGILGIINKKTDAGEFKKALDRLSHRGPDGYGIWQSEDYSITLGHRRLSIIDLSDNGKQPFEYGDFVMTFNGEIYNYIELRSELEKDGYQFRTDSDSEVLIASYMKWNTACLHKFNGMWAFVIYNKKSGEFFMARDRFGKKPLFYSIRQNELCFASEMKALAPFLQTVEPTDNFKWMIENHFIYETGASTLLKNVLHFPSGHYVKFKVSSVTDFKPLKYWDTLEHLITVPKNYADQVQMMRELFLDSCKLRMRADVPMGTALSGGLDSSAVICAMSYIAGKKLDSRQLPEWQRAYVATFPGSFLDEKVHAKKVTDYLNIPATFIPVDPAEGIEKLGDYLYYFEEISDTSPIPMSMVYQAMSKDGTRVSMDGHGVDEMFSGYGKSLYEIFLDTFSPAQIKNVFNTYKNLHPEEITGAVTAGNGSEYFSFLQKRKKTLARNIIKSIPLLSKAINDGAIDRLGNFNYNLYLLFHQSILPTLLRNYDRYSMMNGVEIRMPFMDHRIVSFAFSLSWESKIGNGYTKKIIRDAMADIMPDEIVWRKQKIGFQTPILEYVKGPWNNYFSDIIHSTGFKQSGLVDQERTLALFEGINSGKLGGYDDAKRLWLNVIPYLWEENFLKKI